MATYYAVTSENARMSGWTIIATAATRRAAFEAGDAEIGAGTDIFSDTRRKNLTVVSETTAIRKGYLSRYAINEYWMRPKEGE